MKRILVLPVFFVLTMSAQNLYANEAYGNRNGMFQVSMINTFPHHSQTQAPSMRQYDHHRNRVKPAAVQTYDERRHSSRDMKCAPVSQHQHRIVAARPIYQRTRVWHPAYWDECGRYHRGYYTIELVRI